MEKNIEQERDFTGCDFVSSSGLGFIPAVPLLIEQSEVLRRATSQGNADTYRWRDAQGRNFFIKTFSGHPAWARLLIGRRALRHEFKILRQLRAGGFLAAPEAVALLEKDTLLLEFLPGQRLESRRHYQADNLPSQEFFQQLQDLLLQLHNLGFCHGDFRRANIIISTDGRPLLVDWSTAVPNRAGCPCCGWQKWVFRVLKNSDLWSLASIIESFYPESLSPEMRFRLGKQPWYLRLGRFVRQKIYRKIVKPCSRGSNWRNWLTKKS